MKTFKNGKITVSDTSIQIKTILGHSEIIQKHQINGVQAVGNKFWGVVNVITVVGLVKGIRMLSGNKMVIISRDFDKPIHFWMPKHEVAEFKSLL